MPNSNQIILLENGSIVDSDSYEALVNKNGPFSNFIKAYLESKGSNESQEEEENISMQKDENKESKIDKIKLEANMSEKDKLIQKEKIETGNVILT